MAHYGEGDKLGGVGAGLIIGEVEHAVEIASVDAGVVEGDVEDVNWAVLDIISFFTAVPGQALIESVIQYVAWHICITVDLIVRNQSETSMANNQREVHNIWFSTQNKLFVILQYFVYK